MPVSFAYRAAHFYMKTNKRKIAVLTSTRADYWLLKPLISIIHESKEAELQLIVTGSHLSPFHGHTVDAIIQDGFPIAAKIENLTASDTHSGMAKSIGLSILGHTEALNNLQPDLLVVLGDRFETFAVTQVAYCLRIPIAHIHGGEITYGALDDNFRHCMTKLSSMHFVSTQAYKNRVIQLGENAQHVYNFGAVCLDNINSLKKDTREKNADRLGLSASDTYALFCFHPATTSAIDDIQLACDALTALLEETDHHIVITKANADPNGCRLNAIYEHYAVEHGHRVKLFDTLGGDHYFHAISHCEFVMGNSSSGILEAPYFGKPVINLGDRQKGRVAPASVQHVSHGRPAIKSAIDKINNINLDQIEMVYGNGQNIAQQIFDVIGTVNLEEFNAKQFEDLA